MYRANKTNEDAAYILDHLRYEDELECRTLFGSCWREEVLKRIMTTKFYVMLGKEKGDKTPVCMGGIEQAEQDAEGIGCVWFLCTDEIKKHSIQILKEFKKEIEKADEKFYLTYNMIYEKNLLAKKWLQWLGFKFDMPNPEGFNIPKGFQVFYRIRPVKGLGE